MSSPRIYTMCECLRTRGSCHNISIGRVNDAHVTIRQTCVGWNHKQPRQFESTCRSDWRQMIILYLLLEKNEVPHTEVWSERQLTCTRVFSMNEARFGQLGALCRPPLSEATVYPPYRYHKMERETIIVSLLEPSRFVVKPRWRFLIWWRAHDFRTWQAQNDSPYACGWSCRADNAYQSLFVHSTAEVELVVTCELSMTNLQYKAFCNGSGHTA